MGTRFQRRIKLFDGVTLNLGKTGASVSVGPRGAKFTFGGAGGARVSCGVPGTGFFWTHNFTAEERRKARYEAKLAWEQAYAAQKQQRQFEREQKKREKELAKKRAELGKRLEMAALKKEHDEFYEYFNALSSFHKISLPTAAASAENFLKKLQYRPAPEAAFPFEEEARNLSVYPETGNASPKDASADAFLEAVKNNNMNFKSRVKNYMALKNLQTRLAKLKEAEKKLDGNPILQWTGIGGIVLLFINPAYGAPLTVLGFLGYWLDKRRRAKKSNFNVRENKRLIGKELGRLGITEKNIPEEIRKISTEPNNELSYYYGQEKSIKDIEEKCAFLSRELSDAQSAEQKIIKEIFESFLESKLELPQRATPEEHVSKLALLKYLKENSDFYNWLIIEIAPVVRRLAEQATAAKEGAASATPDLNSSLKNVAVQSMLKVLFLDIVNERGKYAQKYEKWQKSQQEFGIWLDEDKFKEDWQCNEDARLEILKKAREGDTSAIAAICEALLPLSFELTPPDWLDKSLWDEYDVAYHVESPQEVWLLIQIPGIEVIPESKAQLSPTGASLSYVENPARSRLAQYDQFAASFTLAHILLLCLAYPFFKKIRVEAYTLATDPATGRPKARAIVQGCVKTESLANFNFPKVNPVEALKALDLNFISISDKKFSAPAWEEGDPGLIWAARDADVPDGLLALNIP